MSDFKQKALALINDYCRQLKSAGFTVSNPAQSGYSYQVSINDGKDRIVLLVFFGRKGNKVLIQGNKELELYKKISNIIFGEQLFDITNEKINEPEIYIGTDESGKGDFFGPLVVAAVYIDPVIRKELIKIGVKDSKELSDNMITGIAKKIKSINGCVFNRIIINPGKYNLLYSKMQNVNRLLGWAHAKALENILDEEFAPEAISDKFGDEKYIVSSLQSKGKNIRLHQVTKAERYIAVAAASIIARDAVNRWFIKTSSELKMKIPKGASKAVEEAAAKIKKEFGEEKLKELVKLHFKTTKKL